MSASQRLSSVLICLWLCAAIAAGQSAPQEVRSAPAAGPEVTIVIQQQRVRFTAPPAISEMRLQVFDGAGEPAYDSGPVAAPQLDWSLQGGDGAEVKSGLYAYVLTVREAGAAEGRARRGHLMVDRARERDGRADRLWITSQSQDGLGGELTVIKDDESMIAGASTPNDRQIGAGREGVNRQGGRAGEETDDKTRGSEALTAATSGTVGQLAKFTSADALGDSGVVVSADGNVGIGTPAPRHRLSLGGGPRWTSNGWKGSLDLENAAAIAWNANAAGQRFGLGQTNGGLYFFRTASDPGTAGSAANYDFMISDTGNVGLGTTSPLARLHVSGGVRFENAGKDLSFQTGTEVDLVSRTSSVVIQSVGPAGHNHVILSPFPANGDPFRNGNVGIGTFGPETKLHVEGTGFVETTIRSNDERAILTLDSRPGGQRRVWTIESGVFGTPGLFGIYDRTAQRARLTIDTNGLVGVGALQITGGADFSENFDVSGAAAGVEPGLVVSIDPASPGRLAVSGRAYDRRVAGIVSGAGGVRPGMVMSQEGSIADGKQPVALTGRVYCWADASAGAIEPGDLLTTSETPGHAMKVADHTRAQGAVLGKAMTGLKEGKGLVLVLVTLQ